MVYSGPTQNRSEYVVNPERAHTGHLGFDALHDELVAQIESGDHWQAMAQAAQGLENTLLCLAAQEALATGQVVQRGEWP